MVFSSIFFLFHFLPFVLFFYFLTPQKLKNLFLLLVSLFFYAWGEGLYVLLMLFVVLLNYCIGLQFSKIKKQTIKRRWLVVGVILNLIPLVYFKYSAFLYESISPVLGLFSTDFSENSFNTYLPLGISFFTFQALSYLVDTYKGRSLPQSNPINLGLYISLFPQLIAGPIVRYHDVSKQILQRRVTAGDFSYGVDRFVKGLGKKVLLANPLGQMADLIFSYPADQLTTGIVWLGALCYSLQIYFDFSGYSDMAIGLGRMFGFRFLENFNFPYMAKSIQDFWRRWHISLSNWFRDYLYIPLGGNRKSDKRTIINLFIVFLLCGLWHGASWTFIVWGAFHGFFLAVERGNFGRWLLKLPRLVQHAYALLVVMIGWVFFRSETLDDGWDYIESMFRIGGEGSIPSAIFGHLDSLFVTTLLIALFLSTPVLSKIHRTVFCKNGRLINGNFIYQIFNLIFLSFVFLLAVASLANGAYNPFIYFRF